MLLNRNLIEVILNKYHRNLFNKVLKQLNKTILTKTQNNSCHIYDLLLKDKIISYGYLLESDYFLFKCKIFIQTNLRINSTSYMNDDSYNISIKTPFYYKYLEDITYHEMKNIFLTK